MSSLSAHVLDASVGVKWFKSESGQVAALDLMNRAANGEIELVAPVHFAHEVLSVVQRYHTSEDVSDAWTRIKQSGITLLPLTDEIVAEAASQCEKLECSFYDALAPACAALLGATLSSADKRAHGEFPGVHLIE